MSQSPQLPNIELFNEFIKDPKNCDIQTVKGSQKYLKNAIKGDVPVPTNTTLIHLFGHFSKENIKEYVYTRMT